MRTKLTVLSLAVVIFLSGNIIADDYESRFDEMLKNELAGEVQNRTQDVYGKRAAMRILAGVDLDEANEIVKLVAEWFEHPHARGRMLDGEPDFAAYNLARLYWFTHDSSSLYPETKLAIEQFFTDYDSKSIFPSENHYLLFRSSRYLMAVILGSGAEDGQTKRFNIYRDEPQAIESDDKHWLKEFLKYRAAFGWGEFDSTIYMIAQFECLINLYDFSPDSEIKELAKLNLDMLTLGMALNSVNGIYGGPQGRGAVLSRFDHSDTNVYAVNYLYFGNCEPKHTSMVVFYGTSYRPHPLIVSLANAVRPPYINRERKHLHNVVDSVPYEPLDGSIRKYTFVNPEYILGCVQFQDDYPDNHAGAWYKNHSQHQWDLSFVGDTSLRVFAGHPISAADEAHGSYWAGSDGHFFQHRNALIALYDVAAEMEHQFIHAYFPRERFDQVLEKNGWLFGRYGDVAVGLKMSNPYRWVEEGKYADMEVISDGSKHSVVCEVRKLDGQSFEDFADELINNKIVFDDVKMELLYNSKAEGVLEISAAGKRRYNGRDEDLDYASYASPYAYSKWGSKVVEINFYGEKIILGSDN